MSPGETGEWGSGIGILGKADTPSGGRWTKLGGRLVPTLGIEPRTY